MKVAIQARLKNGILWEAVKEFGSQAALAHHLGVQPWRLGMWLNFQAVPDFDSPIYGTCYEELADKLLVLTGHTMEEIFPPEIRNKAFLKRKKRIDAIVEMPVEQLVEAGAVPLLPPAPDELLFNEDRRAIISSVLKSLRPNQAKVVRLRFGLEGNDEHSLQEVAAKMNVTRERVRQIETIALRKMRNYTNRNKLIPAEHYQPENLPNK